MNKYMQDAEVLEQVEKKRFLIEAFLYTISKDDSMLKPDNMLKHAITSHFLHAVIFELIIKLLYELNQKKTALFTHNILKVFDELNQDTKNHLVSKFNDAITRRKKQFAVIDVQFHSLRDVLMNNAKTIKNFKYDAKGVSSNSPVDEIFYNEIFEHIDGMVAELNV